MVGMMMDPDRCSILRYCISRGNIIPCNATGGLDPEFSSVSDAGKGGGGVHSKYDHIYK